MPLIEHRPWVGPQFKAGVCGQRVLIVGYSHYSDNVDHEGLTEECVQRVMRRCCALPFFTKIAGYFEFDLEDFWNGVAFFNFLPCIVGGADAIYDRGSTRLTEAGKDRALRIIRALSPQKIFVFSKKAWWDFPESIESSLGQAAHSPLGWVSYPTQDDVPALAVGLRHPQWATHREQSEAVSEILAIPPYRDCF